MNDTDFIRLEKLNINIDIWIDEERYKDIYDSLRLRDSSRLMDCFPSHNAVSTHMADDKWSNILNTAEALPIDEAIGIPLTDDLDPVIKGWSKLLYAKLIRARIQEMGSDCYLRRLDDVMTYLESNLTPVILDNTQIAKLSVFCLFELSAESLDYGTIGFSKRAWQILKRERKRLIDEDFYWFYDLLAHFNYGVGYFHLGNYRLAVMEFNFIIKEITVKLDEPQNSGKKTYYNDYNGDQFLFLPSVLYRADVQIKLQLAYHALDTLNRFFPDEIEGNIYKRIRAELIRADARQLMYDQKKSWDHLKQAYRYIAQLENLSKRLGDRPRITKLPDRLRNRPYLNIKGRFIDIFIEDYLNWLEVTYGSVEEDIKTNIEYKNSYDNALSCFKTVQSVFSDTYSRSVRYNAYQRNGYYQQLAALLSWLTKKYEIKEEYLCCSENGSPRPEFCIIAENLYLTHKNNLMRREDSRSELECPECEWQGIDLERLGPEHYEWFTESMLGFYKNMREYYASLELASDSEETRKKDTLAEDKEKFIKRLLRIERVSGGDLRIHDLNLRYKSEDVLENLPLGESGRLICHAGGQINNSPNINIAFSNLLACIAPQLSDEDLINSRQYEQIMKRWRNYFTHQLKSRSTHKAHKNGIYFVGLQRWNSSSPAQGRSVGGGYLLYKTDNSGTVELGVAIDPGFDFLRNLFHTGFSLDDIDIILISHAHPDHIRDFESIAIMLYELKKLGGKKRKIHVILSLGAYKRLEHIIESPTFRFFIEPYIIDVHKEIDTDYFEHLKRYHFDFEKETLDEISLLRFSRYRSITGPSRNGKNYPKLSVCPTRAYHNDSSDYSDSFGFLLTMKLSDVEEITLGYTGDTKWVYSQIKDPLEEGREITDISTQYRKCETLVAHLGSLIHNKKSFSDYYQCKLGGGDECERLVQEENHPYLMGMLRLFSSLYRNRKRNNTKQLVLLGEFGEELRGGIRVDLIKRLKKAYGERLVSLPLDVGMDIQLWRGPDSKDGKSHLEQKVWCIQCEEFVDIEEADFERYGVDEALYCVCKTCCKATPMNVLQDRLRQLYEIGYELKTQYK